MKRSSLFSKTAEWMAPLVFAFFGLCLLFVLLYGARVYRTVVARDEEAYLCRTACQYLATRVRQADVSGAVTVEIFDGVEALVLREEVDGESYLTRVYCADGLLWELYSVESGDFSPADGAAVCPADALECSLEEGVLSIELSVQGETRAWSMLLRSAGGAYAQ